MEPIGSTHSLVWNYIRNHIEIHLNDRKYQISSRISKTPPQQHMAIAC
jgi:hypothetical protein